MCEVKDLNALEREQKKKPGSKIYKYCQLTNPPGYRMTAEDAFFHYRKGPIWAFKLSSPGEPLGFHYQHYRKGDVASFRLTVNSAPSNHTATTTSGEVETSQNMECIRCEMEQECFVKMYVFWLRLGVRHEWRAHILCTPVKDAKAFKGIAFCSPFA